MTVVRPILAIILLCNGCGREPRQAAGAEATSARIVNGTRYPQNVSMSVQEIMAIGYIDMPDGYCTGTLIAPQVVATAKHCTEGLAASQMGFLMGMSPNAPQASVPVAEVHEHPNTDFSLLLLGLDATTLAEVTPIGLNREVVDSAWVGRWVDASGYGDTRSDDTGRFFASVQITGYDHETVRVDGHGQQGICYGDSGGPILWQPDVETPVVVVGTEQWGDPSCVDVDHLTRADFVATWADGQQPASYVACGEVSSAGRCAGDVVEWCNGYFLRTQDCAETGSACAMASSRGYGCLPPECGEVDYRGACQGDVAVWCSESGVTTTRDCAAEGKLCAVSAGTGRAMCDCLRCDGLCTDVETSSEHCGACGNSCARPHAVGACVDGGCLMTGCEAGYADSDGDAANGCEDGGEEPEPGCSALGGGASAWVGLGLVVAGLRRRRARVG